MRGRAWFHAARSALVPIAAALALVAGIALPAHGGGPLILVNQQPVVYPNGGTSLTLNLEQGPLGTRTNAQATAIVQNAIAMWNGVATSTMRLRIGAPLAADYTTANYGNVFQRFSDGLNPIIFDTDGSITDALFGVGAKASILGFAGSAYYTSGALAGKYAEGQAVLNGSINISDATWTVVLAHEIGHFFGLDHSQLDSTQGLASSNYVLMYPIAYRSLQTLHEDDVAAVTSLYPTANVGSTYGQLNGTFTTGAGTPILGANIWARDNVTGKVYSVVSDFLTQGNGYFRLYLPAGTYTLNAESIASNFTGGSSVGPYSETSGSPSFQSPHPITPVALGGVSARQIVITAGCLATAAFRLDGTGSVSGNCAGSTPSSTTTSLTSSSSPATAGSNVTFTATVLGAAPTGSVNFKDGGTTITGCGAVALSGSGNSKIAACSSSALVVGAHSLVAAYSGDAGNSASTSNTLSQVINSTGSGSSGNVALASAGAVASASSSFGAAFTVAAVNDNERAGVNWGNGGGWQDATAGAYPDWVQIQFSGTKTIDRVVVYTVQDNYANPVEPTDTQTFSLYGIKDFAVQGWNGSGWTTLAAVSGNNLVKRSVTFTAFTTDRIRVKLTSALNSYSRITEIEAWSVVAAGLTSTTTSLTSSANPATAGANVTLTTTVVGTAPTGSVNFKDGGTTITGCGTVALSGSGNSKTAVCSSSALPAGAHNIVTAYGGDAGNSPSTSNPLSQVINSAANSSSNVALASAGAVASASSTFSAAFPVAAVNDNERAGVNWGNGGGWKDATGDSYPDSVQIKFSGTKTIDRVVVYTVQDNSSNPIEPTDSLTFSTSGLKDFLVQGWTGSGWTTLATVSGNTLVKRSVTFAAFATDRIRIKITSALNSYSCITEIEAWGQ